MVVLSSASCLVFGASGGLGRPICEELARRGANLTMVGRDFSRLSEVDADGPRLEIDLRDPDGARGAMQQACDTYGKLDVVVNAVGVVAFGKVKELDTDVLEELFLTNTFVPVFIAKAALDLVGEGGMVVNIPGVIAEKNLPGMAAYGASKAALQSWDDAFRREARASKIAVLDARPGHTETGLASRAIAGTPPKFPLGLEPSAVASRIVDGIEKDEAELDSSAF